MKGSAGMPTDVADTPEPASGREGDMAEWIQLGGGVIMNRWLGSPDGR